MTPVVLLSYADAALRLGRVERALERAYAGGGQ